MWDDGAVEFVNFIMIFLWRDVGQGFSAEILGAHTYTWSMFIYWVCVVMMGALLVTMKDGEATSTTRPLRPLERLTMYVLGTTGLVSIVDLPG